MVVVVVLILALAVAVIAGQWKAFDKTGAPGWGAIVPIYNLYLMTKMAEKPAWWILLLLIPIVNLVVVFTVAIQIAKGFGKSDAFGVGLGLFSFIFWPILGFGDAAWQKAPIAS